MKWAIIGVWLIVLSSISLEAQADRNKRAWKLMQKGRFEKAYALLHKNLDKDSTDGVSHYLLARYFLADSLSNYDLDSARIYIQEANRLKDRRDGVMQSLGRLNQTPAAIEQLEDKVDSLAYVEATENYSVEAFTRFIAQHPTANQIPAATSIRNQLAFEEAQTLNTSDAYREFYQTYPRAQQVEAANELYESALFRESTLQGTLSSYETFLQEHPETPYREEIEQEIYEMYLLRLHHEPVLSFLKKYNTFPQARLALNQLFHLLPDSSQLSVLNDISIPDPWYDSLLHVHELEHSLLIPILADSLFGVWIANEGTYAITPQFRALYEPYLCGRPIEHVLIGKKDERLNIFTLNGTSLDAPGLDSASWLGKGLIRYWKDEKCGLLTADGRALIPDAYEQITLTGDYIRLMQNGKVGLAGANGNILLQADFDDIFSLNHFLILETDGRFAVTTQEKLARELQQSDLQLSFNFDDVIPAGEEHLLVIDGRQEGVLTQELSYRIPLAEQSIFQIPLGWIVRTGNGYFMYTENFVPLHDQGYSALRFNDHFVAIKREHRWQLINQEGFDATAPVYDSIQFIGNDFVWLRRDQQPYLMGKDTTHLLPIPSDATLQITRFTGDPPASFALLQVDDKVQVVNSRAQIIFQGLYDEISAQGGDYLAIRKDGKFGLINAEGELLLPVIYDGIGQAQHGYVSLLRRGKFGLYNQSQGVKIEPESDQLIQVLGPDFHVIQRRKKRYLVDARGKKVLKQGFEEVRPWNDSSAWTLDENGWSLLTLPDGEVLISEVESLEETSTRGSDRKLLLYFTGTYFGLLSPEFGELVPPYFNDILFLVIGNKPVYIGERNIREIGYNALQYFDATGRLLLKTGVADRYIEKLYCF